MELDEAYARSLSDMGEFFRYLVSVYGEDVYNESRRLSNMIADLSCAEARVKRVYRRAILDDKLSRKVYGLKSEGERERTASLERMAYRVSFDNMYSEELGRQIVSAFAFGLFGEKKGAGLCSSFPTEISTKASDEDGSWIDMYDVEYSADKKKLKKCRNRSISKYSIPEGVEVICDHAFFLCRHLLELELPKSIIAIGKCVIGSHLQTLELPSNVRYIGEGAFIWCNLRITLNSPGRYFRVIDDLLYTADLSKLLYCPTDKTMVNLPDRLKRVGDSAFHGCKNLSEISLPNGLTSLGAFAFYHCESLKKIILPKSMECIGNSCFSGCDSLTEITMNEGLKSIGCSIISGASHLSHIDLPSSLTEIKEATFVECNASLKPGNKNFVVRDGLLYTADLSTVLYCPNKKSSVNLPPQLKRIGRYAFSHCDKITEITLPEGLISIGESAFSFCESLSYLVLPSSLIKIEGDAFYSCKSLKYIRLNENLKK